MKSVGGAIAIAGDAPTQFHPNFSIPPAGPDPEKVIYIESLHERVAFRVYIHDCKFFYISISQLHTLIGVFLKIGLGFEDSLLQLARKLVKIVV